ncbi:hypothetical protein RUM44_004873 [Polyplax serrata]|uniref:Uncharacterized protein n=1 Tax=Polyplax serrata TaxID=468196 RepID=A0ABR1B442_POLSC
MADRYLLVKVLWFTQWVVVSGPLAYELGKRLEIFLHERALPSVNASQEDIKNRYKSKEDKLISFHVGRNTHKSEIKDVTRLHPSRVMKRQKETEPRSTKKPVCSASNPFGLALLLHHPGGEVAVSLHCHLPSKDASSSVPVN